MMRSGALNYRPSKLPHTTIFLAFILQLTDLNAIIGGKSFSIFFIEAAIVYIHFVAKQKVPWLLVSVLCATLDLTEGSLPGSEFLCFSTVIAILSFFEARHAPQLRLKKATDFYVASLFALGLSIALTAKIYLNLWMLDIEITSLFIDFIVKSVLVTSVLLYFFLKASVNLILLR